MIIMIKIVALLSVIAIEDAQIIEEGVTTLKTDTHHLMASSLVVTVVEVDNMKKEGEAAIKLSRKDKILSQKRQ